jgi:hypothetical protein
MEQKMDQNKTDQILELLAKMNANQPESMAERKADREMMARMEARMDAYYEGMITIIKECLGKTEAKKESTPKETEAVEEPQEVPKGATDAEAIGAAEDRPGEQRLAVRRHRQRTKRAQENGGPRQKFAAFRGRVTRRAVPALLKGHVRKGPRKNRCSGVRGPGKTFRSRIDGRSLKQRQTQVNAAQETPEGRTDEKRRQTRPECNSGIRNLNKVSRTGKRGRIVKGDQRLKAKRTHLEVTRKTLNLEIALLIVGSYIGLREPGDGTLWKCRPPPKRKR